jgi:hypothetical protein
VYRKINGGKETVGTRYRRRDKGEEAKEKRQWGEIEQRDRGETEGVTKGKDRGSDKGKR